MEPIVESEAISEKNGLRELTSWRRAGFVALLLLSGFCGISYEVLYARILGNFIGDQFAVSSSILLTFMLGIGVGTLCAHRLWRWLWLIEGAIGICGAAFALGTKTLDNWLYATAPLHGTLAGAMLVCFALLSVPSFLIGCSLPLFAGYLGRFSGGPVFARAYMVYNFGAALTVLAIEFWLLRQLGVRATVLAISVLNGLVSVSLFFGYRELRDEPAMASAPLSLPRRQLLALVIASVASAIFQLLMVKVGECFLGPFRETFALVLALVLGGIAIGSLLTRRWRVSFGWVLLGGVLGLAWFLAGFEWVARGYAWVHPAALDSAVGRVLHRAVALGLLMGVPAVAFGAAIPALLSECGNVARDSGKLLCLSSLANAAGFLLMAFVLHRNLDYGVLILVVAGLAGLSVLVYARFRGRLALVAAGLMAAVIGLHHFRWDENLLYLSFNSFTSLEELDSARQRSKSIEKFRGAQDVFSLNHAGGDVQFIINGYLSMWLNLPAEKIVGAFPAMFAPRTDRALVLGVGSGLTAGTAACLFDRLDCVEISQTVLKNQWRMAAYNFDIASRRNVRFVLDDGIHFMKLCREQYPLIINTVTSPRYFSSSKLYTVDFLESVRRCLAPDGVYVTWIDSRIGPRGLDIILKTIAQRFPRCALSGIWSGYFLLLCSGEPIQLRNPSVITSNAVVAGYFRSNGVPPELLPYSLLTTRTDELIGDRGAPLNTMDYPALEFEMARLDERHDESFSARLRETMDLSDVARALEPKLRFKVVDLALLSLCFYDDTAIFLRHCALAGEQMEDFPEKFRLAKLNYYTELAPLANTAKAYHDLGSELLAQGRFQDTIQAEQKALALDPEIDYAHFNLGVCYEKARKYDLALANYLEESRLDPDDVRVWFSRGRVHFKLRQYEQALKLLHRAIAEEDQPEFHFLLSQVLEATGQKTEAEKEFQRGLTFGIKPAVKAARKRQGETADF